MVTQYRIFPPDVVPMRPLTMKLGMEALQALFNFRDAWLPEEGVVRFEGGAVRSSKANPTWISWLTVNDRRIALQVLGDSRDATGTYEAIAKALAVHAPSMATTEPLILAEETVCALDLNFHWYDLLAAQAPAFIETLLESVTEPGVKPFLKTTSLRFQIGFKLSDELEQRGVSSADKMFVIEPRTDVPLSERRYYSASPASSDIHFRLLEVLESTVSGEIHARKPTASRKKAGR